MRLQFRAGIVAGAIMALVACGGGGDSHPPAQPAGFDVDAAFNNALAGATLTGLRAADPAGVQYSATLAYTALPDGDFAGVPARRSLQTSTVGRAGEASMVSAVTVFYATQPSRLLGTVTDTGKTTVFSQSTQLPNASPTGRSGVFSEGVVYASPALLSPIGTETLSWSLEPDAGGTALACLISVSRSAGSVSTEKDCFRIDAAGNISGGTIYIDRPGVTLFFTR
jgi:hypothetical protein